MDGHVLTCVFQCFEPRQVLSSRVLILWNATKCNQWDERDGTKLVKRNITHRRSACTDRSETLTSLIEHVFQVEYFIDHG